MQNKQGKFSIIKSVLGFFLFLYYFYHKETDILHEKTNFNANIYKSIKLNETNYKRIKKDTWILFISLNNKIILKRQEKIITKYYNLAVLHVDSIFCAKLATFFDPKTNNSVYLVKNGHIKNIKKKLNFNERIDPWHAIDLYYFVKQKEFENYMRSYIKKNYIEIIMFLTTFL